MCKLSFLSLSQILQISTEWGQTIDLNLDQLKTDKNHQHKIEFNCRQVVSLPFLFNGILELSVFAMSSDI